MGGQWKIVTEDMYQNASTLRLCCHYVVNNRYFAILGNILVASYLLGMALRSHLNLLWDLSKEQSEWGKH
jgi:hypothetical protein